jgi:hypothetical protein
MLKNIRLVMPLSDLKSASYLNYKDCPAARACNRRFNVKVEVGGFGNVYEGSSDNLICKVPDFRMSSVEDAIKAGKDLVRIVAVDTKYLKPRVRKSRAMSTMQKLFNRIVRHLLKQNAQAMLHGSCMYRAPDGKRCAVGGVLPNRLYKPNMERKSYDFLVQSFPEVGEHFGVENKDLLSACQRVHDDNLPCYWLDKLAAVAVQFGLDFPKIKSA